MRKIGVTFFLLIYLFSSTELAELLRLDVLFEHYAEHKEESSQISFSNFLYMHYIDHGIENGDNDKDSDLPFHSNSHNEMVNFTVPILIPVNHYSISFVPVLKNDEKKSFYDVHDSMTSSFLSSIWQPPQIS
jgi:hypothetical protein